MKNLVVLIYFLLSVSVSSALAKPEFILRVHGSNTVGAKLAYECAKSYLSTLGVSHTKRVETDVANEYIVSGFKGSGFDAELVQIQIAAHGSSTGFKALAEAKADVAMSSRPIKDKEVQALKHLGLLTSTASEHAIAIDGLAIIVHPENPIKQLTVEQIAQLFSGEISNWKELGYMDMEVNLYARDNNSGTWDTFKNLVLQKKYQLSDKAERFESNDNLSDAVFNDHAAIGFTGLASVRWAKLLAVSEGGTTPLIPNEFSIATEDYALSRRLFMYIPEYSQSAFAREFIEHCQSTQGQEIVRRVGFVSQNITMFEQKLDAAAPESYQALAAKGKRLSVNFRFDKGSPYLDNKAYRDVERLSAFMRQPENKHLQLHLVGFSDANATVNSDMLLSKFRALAVRGQLMQDGIVVTNSIALGSFLPVAPNDHSGKKLKNGRVEAWVIDPG
jgi:phosphate transport system substrate-binding protein